MLAYVTAWLRVYQCLFTRIHIADATLQFTQCSFIGRAKSSTLANSGIFVSKWTFPWAVDGFPIFHIFNLVLSIHLEVRNFEVLSRINPWRVPLKSIAIPASVHNHNAQTKRTQHKSIVKLLYKGRWQHLLINLQHCKPLYLMCSERHFHDTLFYGFLSSWPFEYVPSVEQANNYLWNKIQIEG